MMLTNEMYFPRDKGTVSYHSATADTITVEIILVLESLPPGSCTGCQFYITDGDLFSKAEMNHMRVTRSKNLIHVYVVKCSPSSNYLQNKYRTLEDLVKVTKSLMSQTPHQDTVIA